MSWLNSPWFWPLVHMLITWACAYGSYRLGRIRGLITRDSKYLALLTAMHMHIQAKETELAAANAHLNHMKANR